MTEGGSTCTGGGKGGGCRDQFSSDVEPDWRVKVDQEADVREPRSRPNCVRQGMGNAPLCSRGKDRFKEQEVRDFAPMALHTFTYLYSCE